MKLETPITTTTRAMALIAIDLVTVLIGKILFIIAVAKGCCCYCNIFQLLNCFLIPLLKFYNI